MTTRRVVTGHDEAGKAVILSDGPAPRVITSKLQDGLAFHEFWHTQASPVVRATEPDPAAGDGPISTAPPAGGTILRIVDMPIEGPEIRSMPAEKAAALFERVGLHPPVARQGTGLHPMMHRTHSVDYGIVLEGEVFLILDDSEVKLKPGDIVVQRGTIHAWSNRGPGPARMAFVLVDARLAPELAALVE